MAFQFYMRRKHHLKIIYSSSSNVFKNQLLLKFHILIIHHQYILHMQFGMLNYQDINFYIVHYSIHKIHLTLPHLYIQDIKIDSFQTFYHILCKTYRHRFLPELLDHNQRSYTKICRINCHLAICSILLNLLAL